MVVKVPKRAGVDTEGRWCRDVWEDQDKIILILHGHFLLELLKEMGAQGVCLHLCSLLAAHRAQRRTSCWAWDNTTQGVGVQGGCAEGHSRLGGHCCSRECTPGHGTPLLSCNETTRVLQKLLKFQEKHRPKIEVQKHPAQCHCCLQQALCGCSGHLTLSS